MRAGIVCGLRLEARCFADHEKTPHSDLDLAVGAGAAAAAAAASLIRGKAPALMSVGLAGALDGSLNTGDVILATRVIDTLGNGYECDTAWREQLMVAVGRAGLPVRLGGLLGGEAVFASRDADDLRPRFHSIRHSYSTRRTELGFNPPSRIGHFSPGLSLTRRRHCRFRIDGTIREGPATFSLTVEAAASIDL